MPACTKCELYKTCSTVRVGGDGSPTPKVLLVGRDPGDKDDKVGRAFVGDAGKLLRATLSELEFVEGDLRFTNLVRCHAQSKEGPTPAQMVTCFPYLEEEVSETSPQVVVLLGQEVSHYVLRVKDKMNGMRGRPHTVTFGGVNYTAFVTHHPNRLLRNPSLVPEFAQDLQLVKDFVDGTLTSSEDIEVISVRSEEDLSTLVDTVVNSGAPFTLDIETTSLYPYFPHSRVLSVGISFSRDLAYVIPYKYGYPGDGEEWGAEAVDAWASMAKPYIQRLLSSANQKCGQSVMFDYNYLNEVEGIQTLNISDDTMLLHYTLDERVNTHGLDQLAPIVGMAGYSEVISEYHKKGGGDSEEDKLYKAPWDLLARYNGLDCVCTFRLWENLKERVEDNKDASRVYHTLLLPAMLPLVALQRNGVAIDTAALPAIRDDLDAEIHRVEMDVLNMDFVEPFIERYYEYLTAERAKRVEAKKKAQQPAYEKWVEEGKPPEKFKWAVPPKMKPEELIFSAGSDKKLGFVLFSQLGLTPVHFSKLTKVPSTDEETLLALSVHHELPEKVLELRKNTVLRNTYWEMLNTYTVGGMLHPAFHLHTTSTGRLSSSRPPLQNFPKKTVLRDAFVSRFGSDGLMTQLDLSQAELRVMAALSGDEVLRQAFLSDPPLDVHKFTASEAFEVPFDDVTPEQRSDAKAINFGIIYGITPIGLAKQIHKPKETAAEYIERYLQRMSGVKAYMDKVTRFLRKNGYAKSKLGRIRHLEEINSSEQWMQEEAIRQGINHTVQGPASDWTLLSFIELHFWLQKQGLRTKIWDIVHDAIYLDCPIDEVDVVIPKAKQIMERPRWDWLDIPMVVEVEIGTTWLNLEKIAA